MGLIVNCANLVTLYPAQFPDRQLRIKVMKMRESASPRTKVRGLN